MVEWFVGVAAIGVVFAVPLGLGYCVNYRELPENKSPMNNWQTGILVLCALTLGLVGPWLIGDIILACVRVIQ